MKYSKKVEFLIECESSGTDFDKKFLAKKLSSLCDEERLQLVNYYYLKESNKAIEIAASLSGVDEKSISEVASFSDLKFNGDLYGALLKKGDEYKIELDAGIGHLLSEIVKLLSLFVGVIKSNGHFQTTSHLSRAEGSALVCYLMRTYSARGSILNAVDLLKEVGKNVEEFSFDEGNLSSMAHHFVVGHELGHLVSYLNSEICSDISRFFRTVLQNTVLKKHLANRSVNSWAEEFSADSFGFKVAVEIAKKNGVHPIFSYCGAQLFLCAAYCVLKVMRIDSELSETHPIFYARMLYLERSVVNLPKEIASTGKALTDSLIEAMEPTCSICDAKVKAPVPETSLILGESTRFISPCCVCDMWVCSGCMNYSEGELGNTISSELMKKSEGILNYHGSQYRTPICPKCSHALGIGELNPVFIVSPDKARQLGYNYSGFLLGD